MQFLNDKISGLKDMGITLPDVPACITSNLAQAFGQRPYQAEAFSRFVFYLNNSNIRKKPAQLLFHMATGSGKTLIMAGCILYLYEQGYRNFLFFVNSTNIINKTRENFLNPLSSKHLFAESVYFGDRQANIREVDNFQAANQEDINIIFSTTQGLHMRLNTPKENALTYEDFEDKKIVMISDEAHHVNVETKKGKELSKEELEEIVSWEGTVNKIFRVNPDNILLEFTATADLNHPDIANKYFDKLLFDYSLKQFRKDGYSKEVKVLEADLSDTERALQAVLLSQYRRKVFERHRLFIKPVILFKSRTIAESKAFMAEFNRAIKTLKTETIKKIRGLASDPAIARLFVYFQDNNIVLDNLITELREDFAEDKCIAVNSKEESEEKQIAVNTLEDDNNEYRAVFAVDKLNEGWDVLNLFDIVRLYNTRDAKKGKPGKTTMSEAQLIGRGARYCPFRLDEKQPLFQRKYDDELESELRICEELYYHSAYNPRYIQELNTALQEIGIKPKETKELPLRLKKEFKESNFYKNGLIFLNEQTPYDRTDIFKLPSSLTETTHRVALRTGYARTTAVFNGAVAAEQEKVEKDFMLVDFGMPILRKALNRLEFYQFKNLKSFLPNLESVRQFITSDNYLGKIKAEVSGTKEQLGTLDPQEKLEITVSVLEKISSSIASEKIEFRGTKEFKPFMVNKTFKDKTLNIAVDDESDKESGIPQSQTTNPALRLDLSNKEWYAFEESYGTSEEKHLVKFVNKTYDRLKSKYEKIYLVRNERHFQIYNFDDGQAIEPDFVLFLEQKMLGESLYYQVFIEPKGQHLFKQDEWKQNFLQALRDHHQIKILWQTKRYIIWGMPFYNHEHNTAAFDKEFEKLLG